MTWWEWLPWVTLALVPGVTNVLIAWKQLAEDCKFLPFFEPHKVPGVWLWALVQLGTPSLVFWQIASLSSKPEINAALVWKAIGLGAGFVALANARTDLGFFSVNVRLLYRTAVEIARRLIAKRETSRTALFRSRLRDRLSAAGELSSGMRYLEEYVRVDISLTPDERAHRERALERVRKAKAGEERAKEVVDALVGVRRSDLRDALREFGIDFDALRSDLAVKRALRDARTSDGE